MSPDAVIAVASKVTREWGCSGYFIRQMSGGPSRGSAVAEVWASDGAVFYVGADRWGVSDHAESLEGLVAAMRARFERPSEAEAVVLAELAALARG